MSKDWHLAKMNRNKATGSDEIVIEMLSAMDHFRINETTKIIKEIHDNYEIPEDLS